MAPAAQARQETPSTATAREDSVFSSETRNFQPLLRTVQVLPSGSPATVGLAVSGGPHLPQQTKVRDTDFVGRRQDQSQLRPEALDVEASAPSKMGVPLGLWRRVRRPTPFRHSVMCERARPKTGADARSP
jgi:hypothetical protein